MVSLSFLLVQKGNKKDPEKYNTTIFREPSIELWYYCDVSYSNSTPLDLYRRCIWNERLIAKSIYQCKPNYYPIPSGAKPTRIINEWRCSASFSHESSRYFQKKSKRKSKRLQLFRKARSNNCNFLYDKEDYCIYAAYAVLPKPASAIGFGLPFLRLFLTRKRREEQTNN